MPTLDNHPSSKRVKMLVVGDSGTGKTGGLSCLANAGYELFIADLDAGLDVMRAFVKPECLKNVHFVTITEEFVGRHGGVQPKGQPTVYNRLMNLLNNWVDPETKEEFGGVAEWNENRVLAIDTFTALGESAYRFVRALNGRKADQIDFRDFGQAQFMQEGLLDLVMSEAIACNVIICAHLDYQEAYGEAPIVEIIIDKEGNTESKKEERGYPAAIGKKLSPKVGRHFNTVVMTKSEPFGQTVRRRIRTSSTPMIALKNPVPNILPAEIDLEDGYLQIFNAIKHHGIQEEGGDAVEIKPAGGGRKMKGKK